MFKYVITLDSDTQLPRDAARTLVGHDGASPESCRSWIRKRIQWWRDTAFSNRAWTSAFSRAPFAHGGALFRRDTGFDIYTRAVSDVYQDLFDEGSFAGKGIYEVATFQKVLEHRFPCNALLSHDMIEGAYARAGLVSDIGVD